MKFGNMKLRNLLKKFPIVIMKRNVYDQALSRAYNRGWDCGYDVGEDDGYIDGYEVGWNKGYNYIDYE